MGRFESRINIRRSRSHAAAPTSSIHACCKPAEIYLSRRTEVLLSLTQETLIKHWMDREKAAVDYGRTCDKRIAELEAQISQLDKPGIASGPADATATPPAEQKENPHHISLDPQALAKRLASTTKTATELFVHIQGLLNELLSKGVLEQNAGKDDPLTGRLAKLEAVAFMAREGLARELRILKKEEPDLDESILVSDGDDLIPARWLPLRQALHALDGIRTPNAETDQRG
jgi:hypothetical protein